ncbi:hypothetical protein L210DRAFT_853223, partial [Boletus edulis BED1]
ATWLSRGLKIEEAQLALSHDFRKIESCPTDLQKLTLACRVDQLGSDISACISKGSVYLGPEDYGRSTSEELQAEEDSIREDILEGIGNQQPDQVRIPISSTLGWERCKALGLEKLYDLELRLCTGQANDPGARCMTLMLC